MAAIRQQTTDEETISAYTHFEAARMEAQAEGLSCNFAYPPQMQAQWRVWMQQETIRLGHLLAISTLPSNERGDIWISEQMLESAERMAFTARAILMIVETRRAQRTSDLYGGTPTLCKFILTEQSGELYVSQKIEPLAPLPTYAIPERDLRLAGLGPIRRVLYRIRLGLGRLFHRVPAASPIVRVRDSAA
jgi:hypothetical protein